MKAIYKGLILAESDSTMTVEGNYYFPPQSINRELLEDSEAHSQCVWKGLASYYHLKIDEEILENVAWFYPEPSEEAKKIKDYVAFDSRVGVTD